MQALIKPNPPAHSSMKSSLAFTWLWVCSWLCFDKDPRLFNALIYISKGAARFVPTQSQLHSFTTTQKLGSFSQKWTVSIAFIQIGRSDQMTKICKNRPLSQRRCSTKVWSNTNIKHINEKKKTKLVNGPLFRVIHQSIVKRRHFWNFNFYKVLCGKWSSLAHSVHLTYKNFKTTIFKLHDT